MSTFTATQVIDSFSGDVDNLNDFQRAFLEEILKAQSLALTRSSLLCIYIDTDNDFTVNGVKEHFRRDFPLSDDLEASYKSAIDSLVFSESPYTENFIDLMNDEDTINELHNNSFVFTGGNQTLEVSITKNPTVIKIGQITIELDK